jgi:hypothetical protein
MTAATYDFTLSAAQSSASSMIVELQPDSSSPTPGTDGRWQGGTRPRITLNWAANALVAQGTVNTASNSTVDGNAVYKWVKISSTPSDLTLDTSALPTVTITDDDSAGGGDTIVYGPQTTSDSGNVPVGSAKQRMTGKVNDAVFSMSVGSSADGSDRVEVYHDGFAAVKIRRWTGGTATTVATAAVWGPNNAIPANNDFSLTHDPVAGTITLISGGTTRLNAVSYGTPASGTYARFQHDGGQTVTITRLA